MKIVDARGKACPQPVILTKKAADEGNLDLEIIVDNDISKMNVIKFGTSLGFQSKEEVLKDGIYIRLTKESGDVVKELEEVTVKVKNNEENKGYVFGKDALGSGDDKLGKLLMKGFIYAITETKPFPKFMIFLNGGVKLTTEGSDSIEDLKKLEAAGVKIVSCGTCLDFFEIKDKLLVGEISNMYTIVETISSSDNAIMI